MPAVTAEPASYLASSENRETLLTTAGKSIDMHFSFAAAGSNMPHPAVNPSPPPVLSSFITLAAAPAPTPSPPTSHARVRLSMFEALCTALFLPPRPRAPASSVPLLRLEGIYVDVHTHVNTIPHVNTMHQHCYLLFFSLTCSRRGSSANVRSGMMSRASPKLSLSPSPWPSLWTKVTTRGARLTWTRHACG